MSALEIPVGCVLVRDGQVIAKGRNFTNEGKNVGHSNVFGLGKLKSQATLHAEFVAMGQLLPSRVPEKLFSIANQPDLSDTTLYVTVEPCLMCAAALRQARVGKVIFGCANERFGGCGGVRDIHSE